MPGVDAFEQHVNQYEEWFMDHPLAYVSELHAIRELLPERGRGVEIGVGTGRFAAPLGISAGIEPSPAMGELAKKRGVDVIRGVAEKLPFQDQEFEFALMVTTVCFLDDMEAAFSEARRILKPGGFFLIGFVDRDSPLGKLYLSKKGQSAFYREATFYSVDDILPHMKKAGFSDFAFRQTLFRPLEQIEETEPIQEGHGKGSFVVVRGARRS
jgi:SAM-dependent methyltransferase